jgi:molybdopterin synthase sulfur carrier subunit
MIKIWVHSNIARLADNRLDWSVEPENELTKLSEILKSAMKHEPNLFFAIIDETGKIRKHINIFVGNTNVKKLNFLESNIKDGDEISIFTAVSGG